MSWAERLVCIMLMKKEPKKKKVIRVGNDDIPI